MTSQEITFVRRCKSWAVAAVIVASAGAQLTACAPRASIIKETPLPQMKLISESQYRNSIVDIFGDDIEVVGRFEIPPEVGGLAALGAGEISVSSRGYERYYSLSQIIAEQVVVDERWSRTMPCELTADVRFDDACARVLVSSLGERLLRRTFSDEETTRWVAELASSTEELGEFRAAVALAIEGMLASPEFLFIIDNIEPNPNGDGVRLTGLSKAHRLSFLLWNSVPDEELLLVARSGDIHNKKVLKVQVERMVTSDRLLTGAEAFFEDFLNLDRFDILEKDKLIYPAFNKQAAQDAREQVLKFLNYHLIENEAPYPDIFTAEKTFITRPLGMLYQVPVRASDGWEPFEFGKDDPRAGLLSHVGFTALHSHPGRSSATLRGIAVRELLLCQPVEPAPAAVNFTVVQDVENPNFKTARERLTQHRTEPACQSCHEIIDPVGLALENFDGAGAFRTQENGAPIDTSGVLDGISFTTLPEMQNAVATHPGTTACVVEKMQKYALGRMPYGAELIWRSRLEKSFARNNYSFPELIKTIALSDEFYAVGEIETIESRQELGAVSTEGDRT